MSKIDKNTKGVAMFDRTQWVLTVMSIALSVQLSQPVAAAVPVGKTVQTAQTNSSNAARKVYEEGVQLYNQGMGESRRSAIVKWEEALKLYRKASNKEGQALSLLSLGRVYSDLGEKQKALEYLGQSLLLFRAVDDGRGEALTLSNMASVKRAQNNLTEALNDIESSIKIIENLRTKNTNPELRRLYIFTLQERYKFYIDLLMQLHQANPNSGYDVKASEARKRATNH
ncbi:tetratricopeptide repeat protein [Microcoleus sp. MON2_D5]|uniref:tetratricopeptide repeat protein n=1 Tax=Microcoleus sp. MON2_D5 TaxID=2818833 RepID=UPI002FD1B858